MIIKLALNSIFSNRGRAFLTMLGIIIGISSVIAIMSIGAGAQSLITGAIKKMGTDVIGIMPGASEDSGPPSSVYGIVTTTLTYEDALAVRDLPHVEFVAPYVSGIGEVSHGNRSTDGDFKGTTLDYQNVEKHEIINGRFFSEAEFKSNANVAVLGSDIKNELFPFSDPIGEKIKIKNESYKIVGVLEHKGSSIFESPDKQVLVPLENAQQKLLGTNHVSYIRVKIDSEENVGITTERIEKLLRYRHEINDPTNDDFTVRALSEALTTITTITDAIGYFLATIAAVSLIVGGVGITNIMLMTIQERTREIGLRKALGAKPSHIKTQFLIEATVLTALGGLLGIFVGVTGSYLLSLYINYLGYDWEFLVPPTAAVLAVVVSVGIGLVFGTYPANKAARFHPIDALKIRII